MSLDLIKQGINITTSTVKSFGKDYASNITTLINDADVIKSSIMKGARTSADTLRSIRSGNTLKSVRDWFNQKEEEYESLSGDDDDFDAGFNITDDTDDTSSIQNIKSSLDADSVRDISNDQIRAMYGIGSKQTEASIANTAEVVSSINNRSSEVLASINNINSTMMKLNERIDTLINITRNGINVMTGIDKDKKQNEYNRYDITDSDGSLSLSQIFKASSDNLSNNTAASTLKMLFSVIKSGTPADALAMVGHMLLDDKKIGVLGNRSIDQIGKSFNDTIGSITQNVMSEIISSDKFKKLFGDLNATTANRDYSSMINNQYNTKPAVFDGMTRMSVVHIIPELLMKINENLSGDKYHIDSRGQLAKGGSSGNQFSRVSKASFGSSGLDFDTRDSLTDEAKAIDVNISSQDIEAAGKALTMTYVLYLYRKGIKTLRASQISSDDVSVINRAVQSLVNASGKSDNFWAPICLSIMTRLSTNMNDRTKFANNVNRQLSIMDRDAVDFAQNSQYNYQATTITSEMADEQFKYDYQKNNNIAISNTSTSSVDVRVSNQEKIALTQTDYLRGIFGVLNRGINVHTTGDKPYAHYNLTPSKTVSVSASPQGLTPQSDNTKDDVSVSDGGGKGYLSSMIDKMIPKGVRLSMQYFGETMGIINPDNPEDSIIGKSKRLLQPITNIGKSIGEKIVGTKTTDADGNVKRQGGLWGKVKDEASNIGTDVKATLDNMIAEQDYRNLKRDVKNGIDNISQDDQLKAQQVFAMMQTATADGDTNPDIGAINSIISTISNNKLKSRLQSSIINMLRSNNSKDTGKKSVVGKVVAFALTGVKKILSPVITIFKSILAGIKFIGRKVTDLIAMGLKSGMRDITSGVSNMARGFFGQKARFDEDGNETQSASDGVLGKILKRPLDLIVKTSKDMLGAVVKVTKKFYGHMGKLVTSGIGVIGKGLSKVVSGISGKLGFPSSKSEDDKGGTIRNKIMGSSFMQGFTSVFKETQEKKEKDRIKKLRKETVADVKSEEIYDVLTGKKESIFKDMMDVVKSIFDHMTRSDSSDDTIKPTGGEKYTNVSAKVAGTPTDTSETSSDTEIPDLSSMSGVGGDTKGGGKAGKGKLGFDLGKIIGGFSSALLGIGKIILTVVASLEGFKALTSLIEQVFKDGLQPLNEAFFQIIDVLKPIVKIVTEIVTVVAEAITKIVSSLVEVIQPIIEALQPALEMIFGVLEPILDMITGLVEIILAPLMGIIQAVIVPIMRHIGNSLEILLGVVQVGMGVILGALGGILMGLGTIVRLFGGGKGILDTGKSMAEMGKGMVDGGFSSVKSGISKEITLIKDVVTGDFLEKEEKEEPKQIIPNVSENVSTGGSVMDGVVSTINNTYGSGNATYNQSSYTTYMNMGDRGCGPVALADAYSRRKGVMVNPAKLAVGMYSSGAYNPNKGTSVGSFVNTGARMGMNTVVGGVTNRSLKSATPNNPITVMGSGTDFGTRSGNNHYVNVIGTDGQGGAYVSNPLTGRIERRSASGIVMNAKLGIYGSGDGYSFDKETTDAMDELRSISGQIISMFTGESTGSRIQSKIDAEADKEKALQAKLILGDEYDTPENENAARNIFMAENPKRDGESEDAYNNRFLNVKDKYMAIAVSDMVSKKNESLYTGIEAGIDGTIESASKVSLEIAEAGDAVDENPMFVKDDGRVTRTVYDGSNGVFKSPDGQAILPTPYKPTITDVDMTVKSGIGYRNSPLIEFVKNMGGDTDAYVENGGFFRKRHTPNKRGVGSTGATHYGVDINTPNDHRQDVKVVATTEGYVSEAGYSSSMGNYVKWIDNDGNSHRVMHMKHKPFVRAGDWVTGGETVLGYIGNTGQSEGAHLHYDIIKGSGTTVNEDDFRRDNGDIYANPLTYWSYSPPENTSSTGSNRIEDSIHMTPDMQKGNVWDSYKNKAGMDSFFAAASRAGLSPAQTAAVVTTGIWEDSAKKLIGEKSLTDVTYDYTGQAAVGIMNWIPKNIVNGKDTSYGTTLDEQLKHIHSEYFAENATHPRANIMDPYRPGYSWGDTYKSVTSRQNFGMNVGDKYGTRMNSDLVEGMAHYTGSAVVPGGFVTNTGMSQRIGTAAGAFNWMKDNGYAGGDISPVTNAFNDIPPIDNMQYNQEYQAQQPIIINKYEMISNSQEKNKRLKMILENTYNVRAKRVEELLEELIDKIDEKDPNKPRQSGSSGLRQQNLFENNDIPSGISRLSVG